MSEDEEVDELCRRLSEACADGPDVYDNRCCGCGCPVLFAGGVSFPTCSVCAERQRVNAFADTMRALTEIADVERRHVLMDGHLCATLRGLGYGAGVDVFEKCNKWHS